MKIAIDIRPLGEGIHSGVQEYTENLLKNIFSCLSSSDQVVLFSVGKKFTLKDKEILKEISRGNNITRVHLDFPSKFVNLFFSLGAGGAWLKKKLRDPDIVFYPNINFYPRMSGVKTVLTVHDLSYFRYPGFFSNYRRFWHRVVNPQKKISDADRIIAASESTRRDLMDLLSVPSKKIEVIYSGIGQDFHNYHKEDRNYKKIREKYDLPDDYALCLSTIEPRKNIINIVKAFAGLQEKHLVLVGSKGWSYRELFGEIEDSDYKERIHILGPCEKQDRPFLYGGSSVVLYPSYFEGFGLPPLEAMACGTPVITSNISSLPEVVQDAALKVDSRRPEEILEAIHLLGADKQLREKYINKGLKHSQQFSWNSAALETYRVFQKATVNNS